MQQPRQELEKEYVYEIHMDTAKYYISREHLSSFLKPS